MNRNTNFATNTIIRLKKKNYTIWENNKRSTWPLVWWWVLTHNKKPTYQIRNINYLKHWLLQFYTFTLWRTLFERTKRHTVKWTTDHPPCQATEKRKHLQESLTTGGPGKEQGTNKLPPTRILERSKRDGRLQSRGPTNFPGSSSLESISAEWCVCPQEGSQFRMTGKRQTRN